eukprot:859943-Pleurochrysis_carterae.AAC.3
MSGRVLEECARGVALQQGENRFKGGGVGGGRRCRRVDALTVTLPRVLQISIALFPFTARSLAT